MQPILDDTDEGHLQGLVNLLLTALKTREVQPETVLWHYTDGAGCLGILDSQFIYGTQVSCLNDSTEIKAASRLFLDGLIDKRQAFTAEEEQALLIDKAIVAFGEAPSPTGTESLPYFVACFSEREDDLSQWRSYGKGENGYALGFKAKDLVNQPNSILARVTYYESEKHWKFVQAAVEGMLHVYRAFRAKHADCSSDEAITSFLAAFDRAITQVAPVVKNLAFRDEVECRVVRGYSAQIQELHFRQRSSMLSMHWPFHFRASGDEEGGKLPLCGLIVGPCRFPSVSKISAGTLLTKYGYDANIVRSSRIPYQAT